MTSPPLFLHEEALLLALCDERGKPDSTTWFPQAMAAGVLSDLILAGRLATEGPEDAPTVRVIDSSPLGHELIDSWLETLAKEREPQVLSLCLQGIAADPNLHERVADSLAARGILERVEDTVLLIFRRVRYPEADAGPEQAIRRRLRSALFEPEAEVDAHTVALLAIARATELLPLVFAAPDLQSHAERLDALCSGEWASSAVQASLDSIGTTVAITTAAVTAAVVVPIVTR